MSTPKGALGHQDEKRDVGARAQVAGPLLPGYGLLAPCCPVTGRSNSVVTRFTRDTSLT
jgi:hypothetical protein